MSALLFHSWWLSLQNQEYKQTYVWVFIEFHYQAYPLKNLKYFLVGNRDTKKGMWRCHPQKVSTSDPSHYLIKLKSVSIHLRTWSVSVLNNPKQSCSTALYHIQSHSWFCLKLTAFFHCSRHGKRECCYGPTFFKSKQ